MEEFKGIATWKPTRDPLPMLPNIAVPAGVIRVGYRGFFSAVVALWRMNRGAHRSGTRARFVVEVPLKWLR